MSFTPLITKNLPLGIKIYKKMPNFPYASNYERNKVELKTKYNFFRLISTLKPSIGKWEYADLDHFISKQNYYLWQIFKIFDKMIMFQKLFCRFQ